ncbi:hypothetical protein C0J52_02701 [Blattella germanica]|nr:hypothetical protein C0J52_02701 [Blattella germanica]
MDLITISRRPSKCRGVHSFPVLNVAGFSSARERVQSVVFFRLGQRATSCFIPLSLESFSSTDHRKQQDMQKEEEEPTLRLCQVERKPGSSCGFHLSRTSWDPYPWVSGVEEGSPAEAAGLQTGDCVLEVNGEDILGEKISEVASRVRAMDNRVTLLLWNSGSDPHVSGFTNVSIPRLFH